MCLRRHKICVLTASANHPINSQPNYHKNAGHFTVNIGLFVALKVLNLHRICRICIETRQEITYVLYTGTELSVAGRRLPQPGSSLGAA